MSNLDEIIVFGWQGSIKIGSLDRGARTILELLREKMDSSARIAGRKSLKERLGLKGIGCCGPTWGFRPTTISVVDDEDEDESPATEDAQLEAFLNELASQTPPAAASSSCEGESPAGSGSGSGSGMNLAAALAAERQFRAALDSEGGGVANDTAAGTAPGTPLRMSLMRLLEETDGCDAEMGKEESGGVEAGNDRMCCVCMGRKKGAAFIPCGHTFCRVCSRELWLNRGSCPLCNRSILEILDLY